MIPEKMLELINLQFIIYNRFHFNTTEEFEKKYDYRKIIDRINELQKEFLKEYAKHN